MSLFQKLHIGGWCFVYSFCQSLCVLIVEFNPFTLKIITDKKGLVSAIFLFLVSCLFLRLLPKITSESFCLITHFSLVGLPFGAASSRADVDLFISLNFDFSSS